MHLVLSQSTTMYICLSFLLHQFFPLFSITQNAWLVCICIFISFYSILGLILHLHAGCAGLLALRIYLSVCLCLCCRDNCVTFKCQVKLMVNLNESTFIHNKSILIVPNMGILGPKLPVMHFLKVDLK